MPPTISLDVSLTSSSRMLSVKLNDRDREAVVMCNPPALKQALAELIANALKFSPADSQINITQWRSAGNVVISIVDQGPGIPEQRLERSAGRLQPT